MSIVITELMVCTDCLQFAAGTSEHERGEPYPTDPPPWHEWSTTIGTAVPGNGEDMTPSSKAPCQACGGTDAGTRWSASWLADESPLTPKFWRVQAQVSHRLADGYTSTRQVPTFLLDTSITGVIDEASARRVAEDVITSMAPGHQEEVSLSIHLEPVYE